MAKTREREKTKGRERVRKAKRHLRPKQKVQEPFSQALVRRSPSIQIPSEQQYCVFASFPKTALVYCFSFWLSQIFSCPFSVTHAVVPVATAMFFTLQHKDMPRGPEISPCVRARLCFRVRWRLRSLRNVQYWCLSPFICRF